MSAVDLPFCRQGCLPRPSNVLSPTWQAAAAAAPRLLSQLAATPLPLHLTLQPGAAPHRQLCGAGGAGGAAQAAAGGRLGPPGVGCRCAGRWRGVGARGPGFLGSCGPARCHRLALLPAASSLCSSSSPAAAETQCSAPVTLTHAAPAHCLLGSCAGPELACSGPLPWPGLGLPAPHPTPQTHTSHTLHTHPSTHPPHPIPPTPAHRS